MKRFFLLTLVVGLIQFLPLHAQDTPVTIALFPLKNLYWEVKYDSLSWAYADSLYAYLTAQPGSGKAYELIAMDDIRDQMIALNIDPRSPSYETDIFKVDNALGAKKVIWGTYLVKYEKAQIEMIIIDSKTLMKDDVNKVEKVKPKYAEALTTVVTAGDKLIPGLKQ